MQTVYGITPLTKEANDWIGENVQFEPYQWQGNTLVIEHHYIADVVAGMMESGLIVNKDLESDKRR